MLTSAISTAAAETVDLQQDTLQTMLEGISQRPSNTVKAYRAKQEEFIEWMEEQRFESYHYQ